MKRYICVHGHFYQPPRENPWLEAIELQESASPFHDWNERITAECYGPNAASRILDNRRRILDIVNNYSKISFNIGPTLLSWMQAHQPEVYSQILEADHESRKLFSGHGSAMAQVFNHQIMPLASFRDKYTQVVWGIRDFRHRFERFPEGMWLPETAVDTETLEILAGEGILFTVLSPFQARSVRRIGDTSWQEVEGGLIDPTMAYLCRLPSGRSINLFFYDGPISQDIAFGGLLENGERFADRLNEAFSEERTWPQLVHVATDGETYGHHHRMGDMALAYCLYHIEEQEMAVLTVYGEYLQRHPPTREVEIVEQSSWSCVHGVERWRDDCGCNIGAGPGWTQAWRQPLRQGLDHIRDSLAEPFEREAGKLFDKPWEARDDYIEVLGDRSCDKVEEFLSRRCSRTLSHQEKVRALKLLELQRHAMLMYTSCGWFFDEISGIETTQIMRYATRAIQLASDLFGLDLEEPFKQHLDLAPSNIPQFGNGRRVFERFVKPAQLDFLFIGSHYALSSLFEDDLENISIYCYTAENEFYERRQAGQLKLGLGRTRIVSSITWDATLVSFAAMYLGDHNANCGIREHMDQESFEAMRSEIGEIFEYGDIPELVRTMDKHFEDHRFTLWHLFKDEQQKVLRDILRSSLDNIENTFRQILEQHHTFMNFLTELHSPLPKHFRVTAETVVNSDMRKVFETEGEPDLEELQRLIRDAERWSIELDATDLGYKACWKIEELMLSLQRDPENISLLEQIRSMLEMIRPLGLDLNTWRAQNIFFELAREHRERMLERAGRGEELAERWEELFRKLADMLSVHVE
jgi:alpha-amylase/alpha-mannosidase (GH57 family)